MFFKLPKNVSDARNEMDTSYIAAEFDPYKISILRPGWLYTQLINNDDYLWRRWNFLEAINIDPSLAEKRKIPPIAFCLSTPHAPTMQMLEYCLALIPIYEDWDRDNRGWLYLEYFLDWLLYAFGHHSQPLPPKEPPACLGASQRLHQIFTLMPMQVWPNDYFGEILFHSRIGRKLGFHLDSNYDCARSCHDSLNQASPTDDIVLSITSSGRNLLHLSNYRLSIVAQDLDPTLLKMSLVNSYLYAPWVVSPPRLRTSSNAFVNHPVLFGVHLLPEYKNERFQKDLAEYAETISDYITNNIAATKASNLLYYRKTEFDVENWWQYAPLLKRKYKDLPTDNLDELILLGGKRR